MRFSESSLWADSRAYYRSAGLAAWTSHGLATRICNNAAMANAYASVIYHFAHGLGRDAPRVDVVEIGAGTGQFAHLVLSALDALRRAAGEPGPAVRYVLTDVVDDTIARWRDHPRLRAHAHAGALDRAYLDVLDDQPLTLIDTTETLSRETTATPVVVIANYVLDSLPCDVFRIRDGQLEDATAVQGGALAPDAPEQIAPIHFAYAAAASPPYADPQLADLCARYAARFVDTAFTIPVGAVRCLRRLADLTTGPVLVLAADKGYVDEDELAPIKTPSVIQHRGAISMSVNFDALRKLALAGGGDARATTGRSSSLQVALLSSRCVISAATAAAFHESLERSGPIDAFSVLDAAASEPLSLDLALSTLRSAAADPDVFMLLAPHLRTLLATADPAQRRVLAGLLRRVLALSFPLPDQPDVAFEVGICLASLGEPHAALAALADSIATHGPSPHACFAMAMSHMMLDAPTTALSLLDQALALEPQHPGALEWRPRIAAQLAPP